MKFLSVHHQSWAALQQLIALAETSMFVLTTYFMMSLLHHD